MCSEPEVPLRVVLFPHRQIVQKEPCMLGWKTAERPSQAALSRPKRLLLFGVILQVHTQRHKVSHGQYIVERAPKSLVPPAEMHP